MTVRATNSAAAVSVRRAGRSGIGFDLQTDAQSETTLEATDFESRRFRPAKSFAIQPGVGQASPSSFPQNLSFELGEYG